MKGVSRLCSFAWQQMTPIKSKNNKNRIMPILGDFLCFNRAYMARNSVCVTNCAKYESLITADLSQPKLPTKIHI